MRMRSMLFTYCSWKSFDRNAQLLLNIGCKYTNAPILCSWIPYMLPQSIKNFTCTTFILNDLIRLNSTQHGKEKDFLYLMLIWPTWCTPIGILEHYLLTSIIKPFSFSLLKKQFMPCSLTLYWSFLKHLTV